MLRLVPETGGTVSNRLLQRERSSCRGREETENGLLQRTVRFLDGLGLSQSDLAEYVSA